MRHLLILENCAKISSVCDLTVPVELAYYDIFGRYDWKHGSSWAGDKGQQKNTGAARPQ